MYQAFINAFNTLLVNKDYFIEKWKELLKKEDSLRRYKAAQFIKILSESKILVEFDIDLYFAMIEKMTVVEGTQIMVTLLDGTGLECEIA